MISEKKKRNNWQNEMKKNRLKNFFGGKWNKKCSCNENFFVKAVQKCLNEIAANDLEKVISCWETKIVDGVVDGRFQADGSKEFFEDLLKSKIIRIFPHFWPTKIGIWGKNPRLCNLRVVYYYTSVKSDLDGEIQSCSFLKGCVGFLGVCKH